MAGENTKEKRIVMNEKREMYKIPFNTKFVIFLFIFSLFSFNLFCDALLNEIVYIPLEEGGFVYILADIKKIRPVLDILPIKELKNWQAVLVIDGTNTAVASLFNRETGIRFQVAGWGSYPSFRASLVMFIHRNWKYMTSEKGNYWYSNYAQHGSIES